MAMSGLGGAGGARGRSGRRGRARAPMGEINVTPLVDVMLVLLIIFMVTAPLLISAVPVDLPESRAEPVGQPERPPVAITLDATGQLFVDDVAVADTAFPQRLAALAAERDADGQPVSIMLRADRTLDYGRVMLVMGELNRAGLNRIALVTTGSEAAP